MAPTDATTLSPTSPCHAPTPAPKATRSPKTRAPQSRPPTRGPNPCVPTWTELDFSADQMTVNNLGGHGPGEGAQEMRFGGVATVDGVVVDLVVTSIGPYTAAKVKANGVKGSLVNLNVKVGSAVDLRFKFVDPVSGKKVKLEHFYFSFFDIDQGKKTREVLTVKGYRRYLMRNDDDEIVSGSGSTSAVEVGTGGNFSSKQGGVGSDNPRDPKILTTLQQRRSVTFLFRNKNSFDVRFEVVGTGNTGRNMLFGSTSSLVTDRKSVV